MVDLIIPVYNNRAGLVRSLMSVGTEVEGLFVTVVDDGSNVTYDDIIEAFAHIFPIQFLRLEKNSGPGAARQLGLQHTHEKYLAFLDCGDTYTAPCFLQHQVKIAEDLPNVIVFSWAHNELFPDGASDYVSPTHNRIHGKLYRREVIDKYNFDFNPACTRINEDVAFNFMIRVLADYLDTIEPIEHSYTNDEAAVNWSATGPSIVRANDCEFYYHQQNYGFALNAAYALQKLLAAGVPHEFLFKTVADGLAFVYTNYLSTTGRRPEFADDVLKGAALYYKKVFLEYPDIDLNIVKDAFYNGLSDCLANLNDPIRDRMQIIDFAGFLNQCDELARDPELDNFTLNCIPQEYTT